MNLPFDFAAVLVGGEKILDPTDNVQNLIRAAVIAQANPLVFNQPFLDDSPNGFWLIGLSVETDRAASVEFGVLNGTTSVFVPLYPVRSTSVAGGGISRSLGEGIYFPLRSPYTVAVRVKKAGATGDTDTVNLCGDLQILKDRS